MSQTAPQLTPPQLKPNDDWQAAMPARGLFDAAACERISALPVEMRDGTIGPQGLGPSHRESRIGWLAANDQSQWLYEALKPVLEEANRRWFHMDLAGYTEPLQLTEYGTGQFYDWHMDFGAGPVSIRKLAFVVQLTDPADYDGGDLEIMNSRDPQPMPRDRGVIIMFPTFILHRVTPVTRGTRRSLVGWIGGPPLR